MRTRPVILVVDDSLENRQLLGYIFESSGVYQVKYASGGAEAFEMLTTGPGIAADLIVSDVFM
ncbi:MAG: response regulator, partial [Candidatus Margulisiibacteriota bacterium]